MLDAPRRLGFQVTIGGLIVVAVVLGTPYLVSYLGSIVSWPVLLFADVCMT
ncbi:hypothetical protein Mycsm_00443 [Mycobacterium sp. JS623]|uniref:hypothetical protein n=1 Tax=Mycobacterium sp. JS623 TaxID=212767 RepID=UPI0002A55E1A|nr:hypothetical protein [Mycobacterium sp. JS623]AGB20895.1 hypothetical protein Mycsm_00443 [Mycobacterium sp. JS623]